MDYRDTINGIEIYYLLKDIVDNNLELKNLIFNSDGSIENMAFVASSNWDDEEKLWDYLTL